MDCETERAVGVDDGCNRWWLAVRIRMEHDVDLGEKAMDSATREASATAAADRLLLAMFSLCLCSEVVAIFCVVLS